MCGRGGLDYSWKRIHDYLDIATSPPDGGVRCLNVAPSTRRGDGVRWTHVPVAVAVDEGRQLRSMIWPLIPVWLKDELPKYATANCRSEPDQAFSDTVKRKPVFRNAWTHGRRCLVPFSWFYEWDQRTRPKQPWRVMPVDAPVLVMAGLWEPARQSAGEARESFTIVTTGPNRLLTDIGHHRSPVILQPEEWDDWLTGPAERAEALIRPPADGTLAAEKVTRRVNNPEYEGEDLLPG